MHSYSIMQRPSQLLSVVLTLCLALSASFHGKLAHAQDFNLPSGKLTSGSFSAVQGGVVDSSGTLTLNASTGEAQAFYASPFSLVDTISGSAHSFSTFFTFSANASTGNGTVAFVMVPSTDETGGLAAARKTFTIEFNTSCSTGTFNTSWGNGGGPGFGGPGFGGWGGGWAGGPGGPGGVFGGFGGFQVVEYSNNTAIAVDTVSGYGPDWDGTVADPPYFCSQQPPVGPTNPSFQYQIVVEYNASTQTVWVGSPSCGAGLARTTQFDEENLSGVLEKPVYVGFIVAGGGVFDLSQWNFTSNATTNSVANLALSSSVAATTPAGGGGGNGSGSRLGKGYVVAFSVLGAAIGVAAVAVLLCCLCGARRRRRRLQFVARGAGTIPESAVVFDAAKPPTAPARMPASERDTAPLNAHSHSAFQARSTGAASWLQPVAPR